MNVALINKILNVSPIIIKIFLIILVNIIKCYYEINDSFILYINVIISFICIFYRKNIKLKILELYLFYELNSSKTQIENFFDELKKLKIETITFNKNKKIIENILTEKVFETGVSSIITDFNKPIKIIIPINEIIKKLGENQFLIRTIKSFYNTKVVEYRLWILLLIC